MTTIFFYSILRGSVAYWLGALVLRSIDPHSDPLIEFDPGSPWFNFLAALVNSKLVCLLPFGFPRLEVVALSYDPYGPARAFIEKLLRKSPYEGRTRWREQGRKKPSGPARIAYGRHTGIFSIVLQ